MPVDSGNKQDVKRMKLLSTFPSTVGKLRVSSGRGILAQWDVLVL